MHEYEELKNALKFIEDERNYYAGFRHVIETCVSARVIKTALWNVGIITDAENLSISARIEAARTEAINIHKGYIVGILQKKESSHTVETIVSSVYNDFFY